jgi:hypothetical protein
LVVFLAAAAVAACDGGAAPPRAPSAEVARFTGTWSVVSGVQRVSCPTLGVSASAPAAEDVSWSEGEGAELEQPLPRSPCSIGADVRGNEALGRPSECTFAGDDRGTWQWVVRSYTFALSVDGAVGEERFSGSHAFALDGKQESCAVERTATYRRRGR